MKKIQLSILLFLLSFASIAQSKVIGSTDEKVLDNFSWFQEGYNRCKPNQQEIKKLQTSAAPYTFMVFGGTWCADTQYLLPQFYKITDEAGISRDSINLYFLTRRLRSPQRDEKAHKIKSVPTFIVLKNGKEAGRFTETITQPIEKVLNSICQ